MSGELAPAPAVEDEPITNATQFNGGAGGAVSGGDLNMPGANGFGGVTNGPSRGINGCGLGANSPLSVGGAVSNGDGYPGTGYGSGGAGAGMIPGFPAALNRKGGSGAGGIIVIETFF